MKNVLKHQENASVALKHSHKHFRLSYRAFAGKCKFAKKRHFGCELAKIYAFNQYPKDEDDDVILSETDLWGVVRTSRTQKCCQETFCIGFGNILNFLKNHRFSLFFSITSGQVWTMCGRMGDMV